MGIYNNRGFPYWRVRDASWQSNRLLQHPLAVLFQRALIGKLRKFWRDIVATVGTTKQIVPHQFRHSFGTEMLRAGVSLRAVMKLLGHLTPAMTMRYVGVCLLDL